MLGASTATAGTLYKQYLPGGQRLLQGDILRSLNDQYDLSLQIDGNLTRWKSGIYSFWQTGKYGTSALMQFDANFAQYNGAELAQNAVWDAGHGNNPAKAYALEIAFEGSVWVLDPDNRNVIWKLDGDPKGQPTGPQCPSGQSIGTYPACVYAGTMFQYTIPIPACSPGEAARFALASGYTPGNCP